jgi:DEAD/DEAH box helicase domain-containing protein
MAGQKRKRPLREENEGAHEQEHEQQKGRGGGDDEVDQSGSTRLAGLTSTDSDPASGSEVLTVTTTTTIPTKSHDDGAAADHDDQEKTTTATATTTGRKKKSQGGPTGVNRKRKAPSCPEELENTTPSATAAADSENKKKQKKKDSSSSSGGQRHSKSRSTTPNPTRTPSAPWPEPFKRLSQTHRALNLVYTFCCTRKHLATTFENIKAAVQAQMGGAGGGRGGRELTVEDVAKITVLIPRAVRFEYVDEQALEVMGAGEGGKDDYKWAAKTIKDTNNNDNDNDTVNDDEDDDNERKEVLLFEFIDEDLRRQVQHKKTGEPTRPTRKLRDDDLKMPVYGQKQMLKLIEKRNKKFSDAIDAFLVKCEDDGVDPIERLEQEKDGLIPAPSPSRSGTNTPAAAAARPPPQIPKDRKSISEIIAEIRELHWYTAQIVPDGHRVFDPQPPIYGDLNFRLSQNLVNALYNTKGITRLYSHQAEAINNLYEGHHVIVSTSTSSGKSLIYQIPMLHELEQDPQSRGIYIFPTKALAQDQRRSMKELLQYMEGLEDTIVETFDGDTPMSDRNTIRDEARIIFTNPDMLHITILPQESSWRTFLQNLKFVVVDELHSYNGLFGSHVAFIMRRLRRICAAAGNRHVRFISCSATVANPEEHMKTIFGVDDVKLTDFDGSPSGRKEFICWNTPYKDPNDPTSGRGDSIAETARLFCQLVLRGVRVIAFCRIRKVCEIVLQAVKNEFHALERPEVAKLVMGYRGGYNPQDRRLIEREMFEGKLMGIVATNALELGVDIGSLDAVITLGFPFSISNLRQQSGRAGRRNKDSLSVLIGESFATDQHYMKNPDELFTKPNCELQVDLTNELVLEGHVQCAAFEMPLRPEEDSIYFGEQLAEFASTRLVKDSLGFYHCHERFRPQPSRYVSIRDMEESAFAVIDTTHNQNIVLEEVEESRAFFTIYEGGIFMHQGQTYIVKELNPEQRFARVVRVHVDWNTQQRDFTDIDPIETEAIRRITGSSTSRAYFGSIQIHAVVYGFFKVDKRGRVLDAVQVDNPPIDIFTKGMWLDVPKRALEILKSRRLNIAAAIHAAEHAVLSMLPTFVISLPGEVRTECKVAKKELGKNLKRANEPPHLGRDLKISTKFSNSTGPDLQPPRRQRPARLTFYDAKGGSSGSGIAGKAFEFVDTLLRRAVARIEACTCVAPQGCVECVCDARCKEQNVVMSKAGAGVVLRCLLGWEVDIDALPWGEDFEGEEGGGELVGGLETIVEAQEIPCRAGGTVKVFAGDGYMEEKIPTDQNMNNE